MTTKEPDDINAHNLAQLIDWLRWEIPASHKKTLLQLLLNWSEEHNPMKFGGGCICSWCVAAVEIRKALKES